MTSPKNEIVILEDNDERRQEMLARLRDRLPPFPVKFCVTAQEMIAYLTLHLHRARLISLDHDLEPQNPTDPDPGTGRDVSRFLATLPPACPVIIHTTNLPAGYAGGGRSSAGCMANRSCDSLRRFGIG